jgi:hypothetical protein
MNEFWRVNSDRFLKAYFYGDTEAFTVEELYEEFKARLISELMASSSELLQYADIIDASDKDEV